VEVVAEAFRTRVVDDGAGVGDEGEDGAVGFCGETAKVELGAVEPPWTGGDGSGRLGISSGWSRGALD
jgi:hypothetical protein